MCSENSDTNMLESSREIMPQIYNKRYGPFGLFMWRRGGGDKSTSLFFFYDISDSQIVAAPHKKTFTNPPKDEVHFWSQIHRKVPGSHIKARERALLFTHCPIPVLPLPPDHISSPSGIRLCGWWKRLPGSCANELPLLLNDVCKLWPSLLPVHGVEPGTFIRSPQPMRTVTHGVQLDSGWKFEDFIHSSLAQPCGRKANIWPLPPKSTHTFTGYSHLTF